MLKDRELEPRLRKTKRDILKEFPSDAHPGLNLNRVGEYVEKNGLKIMPYAIIPVSRSSELYDIARANKIYKPDHFFYSSPDDLAGYSYFLGLSLIFKPSGRLSPRQFESLIVHEQWHENSDYPWPRIGFRYPSKGRYYGEFLEEGSADLFAANYLGPRYKNFVAVISPTKNGKNIDLPQKYFYLDSSKKLKYSPSALAAYTLELLQTLSPDLAKELVNSRFKKEGIASTARVLNELSPGLYKYLNQAPYTMRSFASRLRFVLDLVDNLAN